MAFKCLQNKMQIYIQKKTMKCLKNVTRHIGSLEAQACFSATRHPPKTPSLCYLCPVYDAVLFVLFCCLVAVIAQNPASQIGRRKRQQGFQQCGGDLGVVCHDFNPEHQQSRLKHTCDLQQLMFTTNKLNSPGLMTNESRLHSLAVRRSFGVGK